MHNPGFTSNDGGVVISLEKFDQIALSDDKSTCDVGPGLRWIDVYKSLDSHGLTVTGGRVPHVGVPGLLLGGGLSFQNSEHGFGSAGVLDYEVCPICTAALFCMWLKTDNFRLSSQIHVLFTLMRMRIAICSGHSREAEPILVCFVNVRILEHLELTTAPFLKELSPNSR